MISQGNACKRYEQESGAMALRKVCAAPGCDDLAVEGLRLYEHVFRTDVAAQRGQKVIADWTACRHHASARIGLPAQGALRWGLLALGGLLASAE